MAPFQLQPHERRVLSRIASSAPTAKELTRAQALLWLDGGDTVEAVAQRLFVSRQTVYNWLLRFHQRSSLDIRSRLQDAPREGHGERTSRAWNAKEFRQVRCAPPRPFPFDFQRPLVRIAAQQ